MCGICGSLAHGRPPEAETVERMAAELDHRGPDGPGSFAAEGVALGFRRLAICDLSDAGYQAIASEDGALQLVHNGEVYNYRELRRELEAKGHRFGVKPFYYSLDGDRLAFASEPRAFRADAATRLEPNPRAVREYLEQGYLDHTDETFFAGIRKLPPAHSLVFDERGLRVERYWRLEPHDPPPRDA